MFFLDKADQFKFNPFVVRLSASLRRALSKCNIIRGFLDCILLINSSQFFIEQVGFVSCVVSWAQIIRQIDNLHVGLLIFNGEKENGAIYSNG
jgi:hypothetical protein